MGETSTFTRVLRKLRRDGAGACVRAGARAVGEALPYAGAYLGTLRSARAARKTLWIHIGVHKTATTALQTILAESRIGLAAHSMRFDAASFDLADRLAHGSPLSPAELAREKAELRARIDAQRADIAILSGEYFSGDPFQSYRNASAVAADLKALVDGYGAKIVLCVRRQDEFVQSYHNQRIKAAYCESFSEYLDTMRPGGPGGLEWDRLADAYARVFGAENVRVLVYERDVKRGADLVQTFFGGLGKDFHLRPREYPRVNESLSEEALAIALERFPRMTVEERKALRWELLEKYPRKSGERFTQMDDASRRALMESLRDSNTRFFQKYGGGTEAGAACGYL